MRYHVDVSREGKSWHIHIREVDRVTQARRFSEVEEMARDLIEIMTGDSDASLSIDVSLPSDVQEKLQRAERLNAEAENARKQAVAERRCAVRDLVGQGISQREAAELLGMSYQRVNQLVKP